MRQRLSRKSVLAFVQGKSYEILRRSKPSCEAREARMLKPINLFLRRSLRRFMCRRQSKETILAFIQDTSTRSKPVLNVIEKYHVARRVPSCENEQPVNGRSSPISLHSSTNSPACLTTSMDSVSSSSSGSFLLRLALSNLAAALTNEYFAIFILASKRS
ncbi:hypothetical protein IEQ34_000979 [Dendrobium chrysotoxum]|uniref:Uncharacterized protein n=1 Tax=Dendrobium chrysotoxum TaxID=161865 RepID=A0AAV7HKB3_DENCH|nr:hypothetical protein IEQ34_000979 [Dendrobium chrysotoxum]